MILTYITHIKVRWWVIGWLMVVLVLSGCSRLSGNEAKELLQTVPVYPGAVFLAEFRTMWPDDMPSRGITYQTEDLGDEVFEYYHTVMPEVGWRLTYVSEHAQAGMPWLLRYKRDGWWSRIVIEEFPPTQIRLQVGRE